MEEFLIEQVWITAVLFGMVSLADYYLTIYGARLFRDNLGPHIQHEGSYELTPIFRKDVDNLRLFSPAFAWRLIYTMAMFPVIYWLSYSQLGIGWPYLFLAGGLFLRAVPILLRHMRNIGLGLLAREPGSVQGSVMYTQRLNYRLSAVELWGFAAFFLITAVVLNSAFFYGGAIITGITGVQHWYYGRKTIPAQANPVQAGRAQESGIEQPPGA
jgi:hypothetical protein